MKPLTLLSLSALGGLGLGTMVLWTAQARAAAKTPPLPQGLDVVSKLEAGKVYALNVFVHGGLSESAVTELVINSALRGTALKPSALAKANVTLTGPMPLGASLTDVTDQWIVFVRAGASVDLPLVFSGVPADPHVSGTVTGFVKNAIETKESPIALLPNPIRLEPGKRYRARLQLTGMAKTFGTRGMIADKFKELGFGSPEIFMEASELPADWPAAYRGELDGGGTRWGEGQYTSDTVRTEPTPEEIKEAWEVPA